MKKINWKVRFRNKQFRFQLLLSLIMPILLYFNIEAKDVTSWYVLFNMIWEAIKNPFLLFTVAVSVYNATNDPTTKGTGDSEQAMTYEEPRKDEK
ncbi:phage holin [Paenilisteria newyorkensis]|uniref:phage holin n=1 Tax=Listeria newyorkensis TaxID=1497681 RepID=UPI0023583BA1|nr:phage holin [Listeria newyorkensis]WAO20815.1 phage holin [Listeria newyorkensis]